MDERLWLGAICVVGMIWLVGMVASCVGGSGWTQQGHPGAVPGCADQAMAHAVIHGLCQCLMPG